MTSSAGDFNWRAYGNAPYHVVVVHGGPGAAGEVQPVAAELGKDCGVLEPLQTADTVEGQVEELATVIRSVSEPPVVLLGHSWGAWLGLLLASAFPDLVRKLILISSGVFEEQYVAQMRTTRLARLTPSQRQELESALRALDDAADEERARVFARFAELTTGADAYEELPRDPPRGIQDLNGGIQAAIYASVWPEAAAMRSSGELMRRAAKVVCPVVAIHGDHDPSPVAGVELPLRSVLRGLKVITLDRCGHAPWRERYARDAFFRVLRAEVGVQELSH